MSDDVVDRIQALADEIECLSEDLPPEILWKPLWSLSPGRNFDVLRQAVSIVERGEHDPRLEYPATAAAIVMRHRR